MPFTCLEEKCIAQKAHDLQIFPVQYTVTQPKAEPLMSTCSFVN